MSVTSNSQKKQDETDSQIPMAITNALDKLVLAADRSPATKRAIIILHHTPAIMLKDPNKSWTSESYPLSSAAIESDITNLENTCDANLSSPKPVDCLLAAFEFENIGPVVLNPSDGPIIKVVGNCAIAIAFERKIYKLWGLIKRAIETLLEKYR